MIPALDISPLFSSGKTAVSNTNAYDGWRRYFYGTMDPQEFLLSGGDCGGDGVSNASPVRGRLASPQPNRPSKSGKRGKSGKSDQFGVKGGKVSARDLKGGSGDNEVAVTVGEHLARARELLLSIDGQSLESDYSTGVNEEVLLGICESLNSSLGCRMSPRERAQICYCLRYFWRLTKDGSRGLRGNGIVGSSSSEGSNLLGVVFEFDYGDGPTLMYASEEGFSAMYWVGGAVKAPHYDGGVTVDIAKKIMNIAREYLPSVYDELDADGGLPTRPRSEFVRMTLVTTKGYWTVLLSREKLRSASSGVGGLYKSFNNLFSALLGPSEVSSEGPLTRRGGSNLGASMSLPLDSLTHRVSTLNYRIYAFGLDLLVYGIGAIVFSYIISFFIHTTDIMSLILYCVFVYSALPVLSAWMESSSEWGYRTLGKRIFGMRVFSLDTAEETLGPSFVQSLARNMVKYIASPLFCFTGFMWALYNPYGRAWHDLLGDTVILNKDPQ